MKSELLTGEDIKEIEQAAIASGLSEQTLRERAGEAVLKVIFSEFAPTPTVVFCGPGKNGEDGKLVARLLHDRGWPVKVVNLDDLPPSDTLEQLLKDAWLIIDAMFGSGLNRPLEGEILALVRQINAASAPILSIDIPTGIETNSGARSPEAIRAKFTVTFFRPRIGHYLYPGREYRGELTVNEFLTQLAAAFRGDIY